MRTAVSHNDLAKRMRFIPEADNPYAHSPTSEAEGFKLMQASRHGQAALAYEAAIQVSLSS